MILIEVVSLKKAQKDLHLRENLRKALQYAVFWVRIDRLKKEEVLVEEK